MATGPWQDVAPLAASAGSVFDFYSIDLLRAYEADSMTANNAGLCFRCVLAIEQISLRDYFCNTVKQSRFALLVLNCSLTISNAPFHISCAASSPFLRPTRPPTPLRPLAAPMAAEVRAPLNCRTNRRIKEAECLAVKSCALNFIEVSRFEL